MIEYLVYALAVLGGYVAIRMVLIPIADVLLFAFGYTIANVMLTNWTYAKKHPLGYARAVVTWFVDGMVERMTSLGTIESIKLGNKIIWKPYFHYERVK